MALGVAVMFRILLLVVAARLLAWKAKFNDVGFTLIVLVCVTVRMTGRETSPMSAPVDVEIHHRVMQDRLEPQSDSR